MTELFNNISLGLASALSWNNLVYCFIGVTLGTLVGVIPGVGTLATMAMLFPLTFYLDPTAGLIMLAGIWYGTAYGGSISAILLNLPGTPNSAVTCLDGYPMAQQGRAAVALFMTTIASFFGASLGIILMMLFSEPLAATALRFGPAEYFSLILMGLIAASIISEGPMLKSVAMVVLGIWLGLIGVDRTSGDIRFTFGILDLMDGLSLVALAMGLFGVAEVIDSIKNAKIHGANKSISLRSMLPTRDDVRRSWMPTIRGSSIGSLIGVMPGVGPMVGCFISYALEKKLAKDPSRFGNGAIEGIMAPESANNAADQTSFIPTMSLGIPGTPHMALILGVLMVHGITPGPSMIIERPEVFWGLVMSFWIGNILLVILNAPLVGIWVRMLTIPYHLLYPAIIMFICIGVFSISNNTFDVIMVVIFGGLGYAMRVANFPAAPLILGFVLGPMMEEYLRRAMVLSRGSFAIFVERPISLAFLLITAAIVIWGAWSAYCSVRRFGDFPHRFRSMPGLHLAWKRRNRNRFEGALPPGFLYSVMYSSLISFGLLLSSSLSPPLPKNLLNNFLPTTCHGNLNLGGVGGFGPGVTPPSCIAIAMMTSNCIGSNRSAMRVR